MTKREMFNAILADVAYDADKTAFIKHEIELLERKASAPKKPTKVQMENEAFKAQIVAYLKEVDKPKPIKEIQAGVPALAELQNQRITHMLTALIKDGILVKEYVKKVPYYAAV